LLQRQDVTAPPHEPGLLPRWLAEQGVEMIIAGGMGQRAQDLFIRSGIKVYTGAPADAPELLVENFMAGSLSMGVNLCDH
jgi:predicted Fe-Mo cluster-binding NifX family protein